MVKGKKPKKALKTEFDLLKDDESRKEALIRLKEEAKLRQQTEERNAALNLIKIRTKWREIMKESKTKEISSALEMIQKTCERQIDRKNASIFQLRDDSKEAEEQYATALRSHCSNIDTLMDLQNSRMQTMQKQFEADVKILEMEFNNERLALIAKHAKEKSDIMGIMGRMEHEFNETEADAKHEFSSIKDDIKNKNLEEKHSLRIQLEGTVEELWRQFQQALNQYTAATDERKKQFEDLKQKDQKNAKDIEFQMKKLVKLQESMSFFKSKLSANAKEYEEKNKKLREEKEIMQMQYQSLKKKMIQIRDQEHKKLVDLTLLSQSTLQKLQDRVTKAEDIITLAELNRKLETEVEKVLPFYHESILADGDADGTLLEADVQAALEAVDVPKEIQAVGQFHKRFNKAKLDQIYLSQKLHSLKEENEYLKSVLRQYLEGITVTNQIMEGPNPLMVVNGVTNAPMVKDYGKNITVVEGAHHAVAYNY